MLIFLASNPKACLLWGMTDKNRCKRLRNSQPHFKSEDDDILDFPIPLLPEDKQAEIQQKVVESFNLRNHAKALLEYAKRAVEITIEKDEQAAINWLASVSQGTDA